MKSTCLIHFILSQGFVLLTTVVWVRNGLCSHSSYCLKENKPCLNPAGEDLFGGTFLCLQHISLVLAELLHSVALKCSVYTP